jgi:hypothetical protein
MMTIIANVFATIAALVLLVMMGLFILFLDELSRS